MSMFAFQILEIVEVMWILTVLFQNILGKLELWVLLTKKLELPLFY